MKRVTVKINTPDCPGWRDFHLFEHQVDKFVAEVERDGGKAEVTKFTPSPAVLSMLRGVGLSESAIAKMGQ